jgi:pimeloyl-ACP methyl ester carboxylesterase
MPHFTTTDKTRLYYRLAGSGDQAIIFNHGWCSNLNHFSHQVRAFSRHHRVLTVDRQGYGRSSVPEKDVSPRTHADQLAELAGSLSIDNAIVVGHAGGGPPTLEFARRYPAVASALVLVDAGLYRGVNKSQARQSPTSCRLEQPDYLDFLIPRYKSFFHPLSGEAMAERAAREAAQTPQHVIFNEMQWILRANTIAMARQVRQPVLWVVSSESKQTADGVRQHLKTVQFAQVVNAGHFLHMEVPDQFNPMMKRFIEGL